MLRLAFYAVVEVSLREVVDGFRATLRGLASAADLKLEIHVPGDLPRLIADPARLREVILNLVDNAVKYTPSGGKVTLAATADDSHVLISVADNGVGIPLKAQDHVFEPFFRVAGT